MTSSWRLTPIAAIALAALLLGMGLLLVLYDEQAYRQQETTDAQAEARILAETITAALAFDDRPAANEYVAALEGDEDVRAAAIYGVDGKLFASYARSGAADQLPPVIAQIDSLHLDSDHVLQLAPVNQGGDVLGTAFVEIKIDPIARRLERYGVVALMATMAALIVIVLGVAHGALRRVNAELAERARDLARANEDLETQIRERRRAEEGTGAKSEDGGDRPVDRRCRPRLQQFADRGRRQSRSHPPHDQRAAGPRDGSLAAAARRRATRPGARRKADAAAPGALAPAAAASARHRHQLDDRGFRALHPAGVGRDIELQIKLGPGPWMCRLDPAQFEAAILNLALNARDAMEQGGTLSVGTAAPSEDGSAPGVVVTVTDIGTGMAPETIERIFEPFYTTKDVGKGSGLGLAQVWGFVTQSGGRVGVESVLGRGTTFTLLLPLSETGPAAAPKVEVVTPLERGAEMILVVEDDDDVRAMTAATLEELGYKTVIARDGPEALAALGKGESIDLLFSDYVMPGMSGAELARAAQEQRPGLKVLLTSGYAKHAALRDGNSADGFRCSPSLIGSTSWRRRFERFSRSRMCVRRPAPIDLGARCHQC